jgi:hypothetical protein
VAGRSRTPTRRRSPPLTSIAEVDSGSLHRAPDPGIAAVVSYKGRKRVAAQLRLISSAPTAQAARVAPDAWTDSEVGRQYPAISRQWEAAWNQ